MKKYHILLLLAFTIMSIVSCKKEVNDGDWPPMNCNKKLLHKRYI